MKRLLLIPILTLMFLLTAPAASAEETPIWGWCPFVWVCGGGNPVKPMGLVNAE